MGKKPDMKKMIYYYRIYRQSQGKTFYTEFKDYPIYMCRRWGTILKDEDEYRHCGYETKEPRILTKNWSMFTAGMVIVKDNHGFFILYKMKEEYIVDLKELYDYALAKGIVV